MLNLDRQAEDGAGGGAPPAALPIPAAKKPSAFPLDVSDWQKWLPLALLVLLILLILLQAQNDRRGRRSRTAGDE